MLMSERPNVAVPAAIQEAQLEFENWRRDRKRGERIPGNLWAAAVELAKQHGVWPTARALHLDHSRLKRCVRNGEDDEKSSGFVELIPEGSVLRMHRGDGRRARRADASRDERRRGGRDGIEPDVLE
jgi:hypothetical protein